MLNHLGDIILWVFDNAMSPIDFDNWSFKLMLRQTICRIIIMTIAYVATVTLLGLTLLIIRYL